MSGPYKCPIGWTSSIPWKYCNEHYLEKVPVTGTDDNGIFISPYLWFHSFHYIVKTLVYFFREVKHLYFFPPCRSSHLGVFCKKGVLRNFAKFTGKHLCQSLFLIKLLALPCNFIKKETLIQVFSCEFYEISKCNFCYRTPPVAASALCLNINP